MNTQSPVMALSAADVSKLSWSAPWLTHLGARFARGTPKLWSSSMDTRSCNPPTKKHQLKVEISRKLLQGEFL